MRPLSKSFAKRSHPARGAWIEIILAGRNRHLGAGRTPQGVRGLKYLGGVNKTMNVGRTPQGVRGLKSQGIEGAKGEPGVAPRKGCVD